MFGTLMETMFVLAAVAGSAVTGASVEFRSLPVLGIQPTPAAFSIWGLIYAALSCASILYGEPVFPAKAKFTLAGSLVMTSLWADSVNEHQYTAAFIALLASTGTALLTYFDLKDAPYVKAAVALYLGWLTVASSLGLAMVDRRFDNGYTLVGATMIAVAICRWTGQLYSLVALYWALGWQTTWSTPIQFSAAVPIASVLLGALKYS